ncbi:putative sporulation protein YtaF [Scopulibacillus daqui]|uniref:Sporulation protein YtaF n=1 Tax=Scopulibacillus daqui TaxID=1469162 RepID=A0ABS2Q026_9BACL|nr:manganese efflux pump [Scopulibacillus daqui]MBM7645639.1 putative sporulation protein YtaF [Scopulibacillus daqui]
MYWLTIVLLGVAANLDNLGIAISYGMKKVKIPYFSNLIISIVTIILAGISLITGEVITNFVSQDIANALGGGLLIIIGGFTIWSIIHDGAKKNNEQLDSSFIKILGNPDQGDLDEDRIISKIEAILIGIALSLNAMSVSFSSSLTSIHSYIFLFIIGLFSFISIEMGQRIGKQAYQTVIGPYSQLIAGLVLIGIGIYEMIS